MTHLISCSIGYYSTSVLCFDPQKVLSKLSDVFPDVEIDREDLCSKEVAWVSEWTDSNSEMPDDHKEMMRRQIAGKQSRMGPAYSFKFSDAVSGHVNRYSLVFKSESQFANDVDVQIREFMATLGAGTIDEGTAV